MRPPRAWSNRGRAFGMRTPNPNPLERSDLEVLTPGGGYPRAVRSRVGVTPGGKPRKRKRSSIRGRGGTVAVAMRSSPVVGTLVSTLDPVEIHRFGLAGRE